jgi:hypothetical protein
MKLFWVAIVGASLAHAQADAEPPLLFERRDLSAGEFGQVTQGMGAGDVDGDGRIDLVVGGDEHLLLYRNPDFTPSLIAGGFKFGGGAAVRARDMNGDGRMDVLTGRYPFGVPALRETLWYENTPLGWDSHQMSTTAYCHDVAFGDLDGDGIADMACGDLFRDELSWVAGPADPRAEWAVHTIDSRRVQGVAMADVDRDGRLDVVSGRGFYRNLGGSPIAWQRVALTTLVDDADRRFDDYAKVDILDLDGDGRLDVFATLFADSREGQVWAFFQPADAVNEPWTGVQIDPGPLFGVHSQGAGSFDGTARPQLMVGETNIGGFGFGPNPSPEIYVYRRVGDARDPAGWERTRVDTHGTHEAQVVDLDGDGYADIAGDEENTELIENPRDGIVSWWWNRTFAAPGVTTTTTTTNPSRATSTSTSTLPDTTCDDVRRCPAQVACDDPERRSLAAAACVCREAGVVACADAVLAARVSRNRVRACTALDRAATAPPRYRTMMRRLRVADRLLGRAMKSVDRVSVLLPYSCSTSLVAGLDDARKRTAALVAKRAAM